MTCDTHHDTHEQDYLARLYPMPGGIVTSAIALVLSLIALTGVYAFDPRAFNYTVVLFVVGIAYYAIFSRHRLVAKTAEEAFALVANAESDLATS